MGHEFKKKLTWKGADEMSNREIVQQYFTRFTLTDTFVEIYPARRDRTHQSLGIVLTRLINAQTQRIAPRHPARRAAPPSRATLALGGRRRRATARPVRHASVATRDRAPLDGT